MTIIVVKNRKNLTSALGRWGGVGVEGKYIQIHRSLNWQGAKPLKNWQGAVFQNWQRAIFKIGKAPNIPIPICRVSPALPWSALWLPWPPCVSPGHTGKSSPSPALLGPTSPKCASWLWSSCRPCPCSSHPWYQTVETRCYTLTVLFVIKYDPAVNFHDVLQ